MMEPDNTITNGAILGIFPDDALSGMPPVDSVGTGHSIEIESEVAAETLEVAQEPVPSLAFGPQAIEAPDDPFRLARRYVAHRWFHTDSISLRYWREEWYRWQDGAYRVVADKELRADVADLVKTEFDRLNLLAQARAAAEGKSTVPYAIKVTCRLMADVLAAMQSICILPGSLEQPAWLVEGQPPALELLACRNGLVHLPSLIANKPHLIPATPAFWSSACVAYDFAVDAPPPAHWFRFLGEVWPTDKESIDTLAEWFGYCLTSDTRQQKMLLIVGPKRSGKGTIARILRAVVGAHNVCGPTLSSLGESFGLWPLLNRSVAIVSDARLGRRTDSTVVAERLLSISGEDPLSVNRKNLSIVDTRLRTRIMLMTNELPRLGDASGALASRFIILRMTKSWYGNEDHGLEDRLKTELPGILLWSVGGWQRLQERGHFAQPASGRDMAEQMADLSSPIAEFLRDRCMVGPSLQVSRSTLFAAWQTWCEFAGREHPGDAASFGRNLAAAIPTLGVAQHRGGGGRERSYIGVALKS